MSEKIETANDSIQDRLADLGQTFNTNKSFGLMGMLEAQAETQAVVQEQVAARDPEDEGKPPEWFEPLNASLRNISETTSREIGNLRSELASIRQPEPQIQESFDSSDPYEQKINALGKELAQTKMNTAWERAQSALSRAKSRYGEDFDYKDEELTATWRQHIGNNLQAAEGTNWDLYFQQQYDSRMVPKLKQRLSAMEAQAKSGGGGVMSGLGALPRGNRNGAPQPAAAATGDFDEDVYRKASARMAKGQFKGFNRLLVEEQNRKLLRTAV